ncbi:ABC transporter ATP-binding protein [Enterococcus ureasiticus]|uniref:ABC-type quaternary amine transporter n=1 Tax=Enterococcus ureasiticus TaxID=903984 RepID=A0A1E5GAG9_9ENTE|nr:ABC transporter ATP-binding protein [Enterococcus ureasiticus]OEG09651.1 ABC transporter ATP-binding protein [Enterococcus ureasiticus]
MINFQNVSKKYNDQLVLEDFDVSIEDGEFFVLVGPSGSGKTTTLKMINRLIEPTDGDIYFNDQRLIDYNLKELRLTIGYVLQQIALFPNLTVAENIELIPEMKHWSKAKRRERTEELLRKVSLSPKEYLHRKPAELSGGEQQRIGILRAIAAKPDIILMDEPFSALDPISKGQLQLLIKELHKELASTVVFVTHDMNEALLLGDRICVMKEGKIVQTDTPEAIKSHPANEFVAQFFQHEHANLENYCAEDLLASGFIEDGQVDSETTVNLGTDLPTVIRLLVDGKTVVLVDEKGPIGEITDRTILRFLETKIEKGDQ